MAYGNFLAPVQSESTVWKLLESYPQGQMISGSKSIEYGSLSTNSCNYYTPNWDEQACFLA